MIAIIENSLNSHLNRLKFTVNKLNELALIKVGIQLINNIVNGSPQETVTPPILTGRLRGSGSVFLANKLIKISDPVNGEGTPNISYNGKRNVVTVGFNTPYAARWHEHPFALGPISKQAGDVGNKFVSKHLEADGKELMKLYALFIKKGMK